MIALDAREWWTAPVVTPVLGSDDVHVWRASVAAAAPFESQLVGVLGGAENEMAARFHFERDRIRYVVAHAMLRSILAAYAGVAPATLEFGAGPFGKPYLRRGSPALEFNLSHSGDVVLMALARDRPVGVDVEEWSANVEVESIATLVFSPLEQEHVVAAGPSARNRAFFRVWSRKEAYIKATGHGVSRGLDHFDVVGAAVPGRVTDHLASDAGDRWLLRDLDLDVGYAGAVAAAGYDWELHTYLWDPRSARGSSHDHARAGVLGA